MSVGAFVMLFHVVTACILGRFPIEASSGGEFCTLEADGLLREHDFHRGDAIVFPSHKPHSVGQITSGRRSVLIVEIWPGLPRGCAHRCVGDPEATCDFGVMDSARENMRSELFQLDQNQNRFRRRARTWRAGSPTLMIASYKDSSSLMETGREFSNLQPDICVAGRDL
eukprot:s1296_g2.t2